MTLEWPQTLLLRSANKDWLEPDESVSEMVETLNPIKLLANTLLPIQRVWAPVYAFDHCGYVGTNTWCPLRNIGHFLVTGGMPTIPGNLCEGSSLGDPTSLSLLSLWTGAQCLIGRHLAWPPCCSQHPGKAHRKAMYLHRSSAAVQSTQTHTVRPLILWVQSMGTPPPKCCIPPQVCRHPVGSLSRLSPSAPATSGKAREMQSCGGEEPH